MIIDEAHGFRNINAKRSIFLGNILRTRLPAKDPRKILLLSATPINNGLEDLSSLLKLLFAPYKEIENPDVIEQIIIDLMKKPGDSELFQKLPSGFRDVFNDGELVNLRKYLKVQKALLDDLIKSINDNIILNDMNSQLLLVNVLDQKNRIAEVLLDCIVVQRSRSICEEIEKASGQVLDFQFRTTMEKASEIKYAQYSDGYKDILFNLRPLFDATDNSKAGITLSINSWNSIFDDGKVVEALGLQRTQLLKRLESSLGSLLVSYVRLIGKHLNKLDCLKHNAYKYNRLRDADQLENEIQNAFTNLGSVYQTKVKCILSHQNTKIEELDHQQLDTLWFNLKDPILADFKKLLGKMPVLIDNILGDLDPAIWPVITDHTIWPKDPQWGMQLLRDEKVLELIRYLLGARQNGQKIVIFSEYTETIEYIKSILQAITRFDQGQWETLLSTSSISHFTQLEILELIKTTKDVTGNTPATDQNRIIYCFAPYYRIGPTLAAEGDRSTWRSKWTDAINEPVNVLMATDILAEGVNLQDASTLINFDMHWNPVKLIQRSGRIDRRLNKKIEDNRHYPELASLAESLGKPAPGYYWHDHPQEPPQIVNMLLPDELEQELRLTKRIWSKAVLISLVLGFDAKSIVSSTHDNFFDLKGVIGINAITGDRKIEQLIHYRDRLAGELMTDGINFDWAGSLLSHISIVKEANLQLFIANIEHESPFGTFRNFQFTFDNYPTAEAATINTNVTIASSTLAQSPESIFQPINNIDNKIDNTQLLSILESVFGSKENVHDEYSIDKIETSLREMMLSIIDPMHHLDIQQGQIKSCFIYQYDGQADQTSRVAAPLSEEVNA